ncbi:MAG: hypothetical protein WCV82_01820 [Candidatus Paceibacterota bacterium]
MIGGRGTGVGVGLIEVVDVGTGTDSGFVGGAGGVFWSVAGRIIEKILSAGGGVSLAISSLSSLIFRSLEMSNTRSLARGASRSCSSGLSSFIETIIATREARYNLKNAS